jgi:hypothetical protein
MSEDREKVQMYDDGSNSFKLLWHELKDVKDVIVHDMKDDLVETFTKADAKIKSYLHYTNEELTKENEALRKEVEKVERVGFKNNVVLAYEGMDNKTVDERYNQLPGNAEDCEICRGTGKKEQDIKKPYISVQTVDPDTEMKEEVEGRAKEKKYRRSVI